MARSLIINDDDFGIAGGRTQIVVLRGTGIAAPLSALVRLIDYG